MVEGPRRSDVAAARRRLASWLGAAENADIAEGALLVAAEEYPGLDVERELSRLRALTRIAALRAADLANPFARNDAIASYLFGVVGLRGDPDTHDDPKSSFLNEVLSRRRGVPLALCIIYMEAARGAGFSARCACLPGHAVVRLDDGTRSFLVDPFYGGRVVTEEDCRQLVAKTTGRPSLFRREMLDGATPRDLIARLLQNLKRIYLVQADYTRALSAVERLLLLLPGEPTEIRDRGFLLAHLGSHGAAVADLEAYLAAVPHAPDAESVRNRLAWLLRRSPQPR